MGINLLRVDKMGIDLMAVMGVDKMGIDLFGVCKMGIDLLEVQVSPDKPRCDLTRISV